MTTLHLKKSIGRSPLRRGLLLVPLLLACFAAVFISAPIPAAAGDQVPFNGTVSGQIPSDLGPPVEGTGGCVFDFLVSNAGYATELGAFTGYAEFIPNLCDLTYTGFFYWTAANRSEEHTSELQSPYDLVCRLLLEKKKRKHKQGDRRRTGSRGRWHPQTAAPRPGPCQATCDRRRTRHGRTPVRPSL